VHPVAHPRGGGGGGGGAAQAGDKGGPVRNGFEVCNIHYKGYWKGWALEIETFWALKWL
jgi:hypothetical protein